MRWAQFAPSDKRQFIENMFERLDKRGWREMSTNNSTSMYFYSSKGRKVTANQGIQVWTN